DLYWFPDLGTKRLESLDPNTAQPGPGFAAPAGSRLAGAAYEPRLDAIAYNGRSQLRTFFASAATGQLLASLPMNVDGANNGEGAGIAPAGGLWIHHFEATSS